MALTNAEKQKRWRDRRNELAKEALELRNRTPRQRAEDRKIGQGNLKSGFLMTCESACAFAQHDYRGPIDREVADATRQAAEAFGDLADKMWESNNETLTAENAESETASPAQIEDELTYTIQRINEHARVFKKLFKVSSLDDEAQGRIKAAIEGMIKKWQSVPPRNKPAES